ncbi:MAG: ABC transporter ATP-binding protein, partial [Lachnospiraceae bacterium]|nr:ABC transporter ATP-binding protein [Lachnospiraceae bacterium]
FVRLAFAVAINIEPEILIVDEALSVGDVFFQSKCYHKFEEFKEMGKTIVFVSHDLNSISKYCDRVFLLNKGTLLGVGNAKEMIDAYKQVLVGQYRANGSRGTTQGALDEAFAEAEGKNPNALEYGDGSAVIEEYYLTDENGIRTNTLLKGTEFTLHEKIRFTKDVPAPIFAFTVKNVRGTEITGTNTMLEKAYLEGAKEGQVLEITFTQKVDLQGGEYLLSLGCTGYEGDVFKVYHRLYDVLNMTIVSDKNTVGYYDMNSKITVRDAAEL